MGTHHRGSPREQKVLDAYIKLARAFRGLAERNTRRFADLGLIESQFGVLETLFHLGPQRASDLSAKVLTSFANVTVVVDGLARRGLAKRRRCLEDKRVVWVELTPKGRALTAKIFPQYLVALLEAFGAMSDEEIDALGQLSRKLGLHVASLKRERERERVAAEAG